MVIGHLGVAMVARGRWPRVPLSVLAVASVLPDFVDLALAALRVCAPNGAYSHSLPAAAILAVASGVIAALWWRSGDAGALVAAVVLLHLPADYITGLKVLWPGGPVIGLDLYSLPIADFALELLVAFAGWRYLRSRDPLPRWVGRPVALAALIALQAAMDAASYVVGPVKPNACATPATALPRPLAAGPRSPT
jgi:hypothetical protein